MQCLVIKCDPENYFGLISQQCKKYNKNTSMKVLIFIYISYKSYSDSFSTHLIGQLKNLANECEKLNLLFLLKKNKKGLSKVPTLNKREIEYISTQCII